MIGIETFKDILQQRLLNQRLAGDAFERPQEVVGWMGAVQSQEYLGAKWGLAQRMHSARDAALDRAFADGAILRTHAMRPTWHFVAPADIRWMLKLTAARIIAADARNHRHLQIDAGVVARSAAVLAKALQGGRQLTRPQIETELQQAGICAALEPGRWLAHLVLHLELDGLLVSGGLQGKQFTYTLLEERVPPAAPLERAEALAELAWRYFRSHGPATVKDFAWWSGLAAADARAGLEMNRARLASRVIEGHTFWFDPTPTARPAGPPGAYLLPAFDEYTVAYSLNDPILDPQYIQSTSHGLTRVILLDGRIAGTWKRTLSKSEVLVEVNPFDPLSRAQSAAIAEAAQRYGEFLGLHARLA